MGNKRNKKIGVFDSGFGGLNILRGIVKELPAYEYVYLGDTARVPYGSRSPEVVYEFTRQAVEFLFGNGCDLVILACNTASSDALRRLQQEWLPKCYPRKRILGVLIPAAEEAAAISSGRIGVMATEGTVQSRAFEREIKKRLQHAVVSQQACPLLVPIIESGEVRSSVLPIMLKKYLAPLKRARIDTLILGCTHYGLIERAIKREAGKQVRIVSESRAVPKRVRTYLSRHPEIESRLARNERRTFYSTDLTEKFDQLGSEFFGGKIRAKKAALE